MRRLCVPVVLAVLCAAGCVTPGRQAASEAIDPTSALVYVYLSPSPGNAPAGITLAGVDVVAAAGAETPLRVDLADVGASSAGVRRLVAHGGVPPGQYAAVLVRLAPAAGGSTETQPPEPIRVPVSLTLAQRQGAVLEISLEAAAEGGQPPVVHLAVVARPVAAAIGLVSSPDAGTVLVLDKRSGRVGGLLNAGRGPRGLVIDRINRRAYVVTGGDDTVSAIDLDQLSITERRALRAGDEPVDIAMTPSGDQLLVANRRSNTLSFIEPAGLAELARLPVGTGPDAVIVDRAGQRAYVFNYDSSSISVVDVPNRQVAGTIAVDARPVRGQFNRTQDQLWVYHDSVPYLTIVDPRSLQVVQRLNVGGLASALRLDSQTNRIYVGRRDGTGIDVYDVQTLLPVDNLAITGQATYLAIDGETSNIAATVPSEQMLKAFGIVSRAPAWQVEVPGGPAYVTFMGER